MATSELRNRILTSLAGVPLLVGVFWQGGWVLALFVLLLSLLALRELTFFYRAKGVGHSQAFVLPYALALPLCAGLPHGTHLHLTRGGVDFFHVWGGLTVLWLMALLLRELFSSREQILASIGASLLAGILATLPFVSLVALDQVLPVSSRQPLMLSFLLATWATDTFAYFGGRFLGKHKLFERASPKKTVEGFLVGLLGACLVGAGAAHALGDGLMLDGLALGLLMGLAGPAGDLLESRLKRDAGLKDSANVLPGHGGVLDRFDSWIFSAPLAYLLAWLGWVG
jgi:phosphatidate cytidylyltransferase